MIRRTVSYKGQTTPGTCPDNYSVTRTWNAADHCGNIGTAPQTITVQDITAPVIAALPARTTPSIARPRPDVSPGHGDRRLRYAPSTLDVRRRDHVPAHCAGKLQP